MSQGYRASDRTRTSTRDLFSPRVLLLGVHILFSSLIEVPQTKPPTCFHHCDLLPRSQRGSNLRCSKCIEHLEDIPTQLFLLQKSETQTKCYTHKCSLQCGFQWQREKKITSIFSYHRLATLWHVYNIDQYSCIIFK